MVSDSKNMIEIDEALKRSGLNKSDVTQYKFVDEYGNRSYYQPRTKSLRWQLETLFLDKDPSGEIVRVWVNALKEVVIEFKSYW